MNETFKKIIQNNAVQLTIVLASVAISIVNLWTFSLLNPLVQDITSLVQRVDAVEQTLEENEGLVERFIVVESKVIDIQVKLNRIEDKIDRLIER